MKKLFLLAATFVTGFAVMAQKAEDVITINQDTYNFGKIKQGVPVTTFFTVTNKSDKPVVLESVVASCGCTTPEWSKEPVAPNSTSQHNSMLFLYQTRADNDRPGIYSGSICRR